ncbi:hypothetical protein D3C76_1146540 [compost metagenome]
MQLYESAALGVIAQFKMPAECAQQGIADRQAETETLGAGLGGEEGFAGVCECLLGEAGAVIAQR